MALNTLQIQLADREHTFTYPQAEDQMILSVLEGRDYPLAKARLSGEIMRLQLPSVDLLKVDAESAEPEILHEVLTGAPEVPIRNIFVEYHAIAVRKYLTEELRPKYDVHLCSVATDRQGTLLFVLKDSAR
tara:strand:- start:694 stop:1086 length:393 start_codon:yes stop_codon:yes gene_type:complete